MSEVIELVRFTVSPERRQAFLDGRPAAIEAIRERFGGLLDARLAEGPDGEWIDIVRWTSLEQAEEAAAGCAELPVVRDWLATIAEVHELTHAEIRHAA